MEPVKNLMKTFVHTLRQLRHDEEGATVIEYGLIAALVGVAVIGSVTAVGTQLNAVFNQVQNTLSTAV